MRKLVLLISVLPFVLMACVLFDAGSDSVMSKVDSVAVDSSAIKARYELLTDADYKMVADSLGIEVPVIKAVVLIEAGHGLQGFWKPGVPIINFDLVMFRKFAAKQKINLSAYAKTHPVVFAALNSRRYGSRQAAQYARFESALTIDSVAAIEGTFWGMFQIGGFNWRLCKCGSIDEFVMRMGRSEHDQLALFAEFITARGLIKYLKSHNWAAFALRYNGPSYKQRGYDTKIARAYARFAREQAMASADTVAARRD